VPDREWSWSFLEANPQVVHLLFRGKRACSFQLVLQGETAFYLSHTELSIGVAADWLATHSLFANERKAAWGTRLENHKLATGWRFSSAQSWQIELPFKDWAPFDVTSGERPSREHPLNWISARFAQRLAQSMSCRLPTLSEWNRLAQQLQSSDVPNLRDVSWDNLWKSFQAKTLDRREIEDKKRQAEAQIFHPNLRGARPFPGLPPQNDGSVWFRKVSEGEDTFRNFFGNVSEFLVDDAQSGLFYAAGASAFSGPEVDPTTPYPVSFLDQDFPDIGLRLALDAVRKSEEKADKGR